MGPPPHRFLRNKLDSMPQKIGPRKKRFVPGFVFRNKQEWLRRAADNIRSLRTTQRLTKEELAHAVGYKSENTVTNWEAGPDGEGSAQFAGPEALIAMRELYGRSTEWLLGKENAAEYVVESVQLTSGVTLTDVDLEEALAIRLRQTVESRMQQDSVAAALLREAVARDGIDKVVRSSPAPLIVTALAHLMDNVEGIVRGEAHIMARERVERRVAQERGADVAAAVRLGADLVIADMVYARAIDPTAPRLRQHQYETAWRRYDKSLSETSASKAKARSRRKRARR